MKLPVIAVLTAFISIGTATAAEGMLCKTEKHNVIIDKVGAAGTWRYRSWNLPKPQDQKPDMEVTSGSKETSGTGTCRSTEYRFKKGSVEFVVDDNTSCTEKDPPKGAIGSLSVFMKDELKSQFWCFKP